MINEQNRSDHSKNVKGSSSWSFSLAILFRSIDKTGTNFVPYTFSAIISYIQHNSNYDEGGSGKGNRFLLKTFTHFLYSMVSDETDGPLLVII